MKKTGLIGYPLNHSFSKKYFTEKFQKEGIKGWEYELYPIESLEELQELLTSQPELKGLNVTIPYKEAIIPYLNETDKEAEEIGAVNTIKIESLKGGTILTGYNTDAYGFKKSLLPLLEPQHKNALILGTGGSSLAVKYVLDQLGIKADFVSRNNLRGYTYEQLNHEIINDHTLIINCTPLGMYPNIEAAPTIPYGSLGKDHLCYDLIYNPETTQFLKRARLQGAQVKNGLEMLYSQAEKAWDIFSTEKIIS